MRRWLPTAVAVSMLAVAAPATADHGDIHPTFAESRVYFECVGGDAMKVQNTSTPIPWGAEAPSRSVQAGAGCGFADPAPQYNDSGSSGEFDPVFAGEVAGNLTNLTVENWILGPHPDDVVYGSMPLFVWLRVDGEDVYYGPEEVDAAFQDSETGASYKLEFTLTGLQKYFATEDGAGEQVRHVEISVAPWYPDTAYASWVWGTSEVPAGVTFNDATPAPARYAVP